MMANSEKYDVFLSFRGEDTRYGITSHIYRALDHKKLKTYIDDQSLPKGHDITPALLSAIERSTISVVIFSENYASSSWCLSELVHIHKCRRSFGQVVLPVFYEVEPSHVRKQDCGSFRVHFKDHEKRGKHSKETIDLWRSALIDSADLSGFHYSRSNVLAKYRSESELVEEVVSSVLKILNRPAMPVEFDGFDGLIGMENHFRIIKSVLMSGSPELLIVGIWGMPGVGKTTIAKAVSSRLFPKFESHYFLSGVRESAEKHGLEKLRDGLIARLLGDEKLDSSGVLLPSPIPNHTVQRLRRTKVLLVLDDVSEKKQVEYLVGDHIGNGSRVIVTTRDEGVLRETDIERAVFEKYEVKVLSLKEALVLFSLTTFREKTPPKDYEKLSKEVVTYVGRNPLAIKVFGSHLRSLRNPCRENWEREIKKLKNYSHDDILKILRISYDALDETHRNIFLDISCFFKGMSREFVQNVLDGCNFFATTGIDALIDKSMITIDVENNNRLNMHDLMQQMGRQIVLRESKEPGNRTRLWTATHVNHVFDNDTGSTQIEGIFLNTTSLEDDLHMKGKVFQRMSNLRLLKIYAVNSFKSRKVKVETLESFPRSLRYLEWEKYPLKSLPSGFSPRYLVELKLPDNQLDQLWHGTQNLNNLKGIDLSNSVNLSELPDLSSARDLEKIILRNCASLLQVPWDVFGKLDRLSILDLGDCKKLKGFPKSIDTRELKILDLHGCLNLENVPHITSMSLASLNLSLTLIVDLPSEIGYINTITELVLNNCKNVVSLPRSISQLHLLKTLNINGCSSLDEFPELPTNIEMLYMSSTMVKEVPSSSIEGCSLLSKISFRSCYMLESLTESIFDLASLVSLNLSYCSALTSLPEISKTNTNLEYLYLDGTAIVCLPSSMSNLTNLKRLELTNCKNLEYVISLSGSQLTDLCLLGCRKLRRISQLPFTLKHLNATGCGSLVEVVLVPFGHGLSETTRKIFWDHSRKVMFDTYDITIFSGCLSLSYNSQDNIISGFQLKVLHMATHYKAPNFQVKIPPAVTTCFPGQTVPYWFDNQPEDPGTTSSSVTVPLLEEDGDIMGFAMCVVTLGTFTVSTDIFCEIEFQEEDKARCKTNVYSAFVGPGSSVVIQPSFAYYVVMWYKQLDMSHCSAKEVVFRFSVAERGEYPVSCSAPVKCGVRIVRAKDLKDLDLIDDEVDDAFQDDIDRSSDPDPLESCGGGMIENHGTQTLNGGESSGSRMWQLVFSAWSAVILFCSPKRRESCEFRG